MGRRKKPAAGQKHIEFDYSAWCRALERHKLPYKAQELCKVIKSYDQGTGTAWPSVRTLAKRCSAKGLFSSRNTTKSWLAFLEDAGFIGREERKRDTNGSQTSDLIRINDRKIFSDPPAEAAGQKKLTQGGSTIDPGGGQLLTPQNHLHLNLLESKSHDHGDDEKIPRRESTAGSQSASGAECWGRQLTRHDLRDETRVLKLFLFAVERGWARDGELSRLAFFGLCRYCASKGKSPGAYLTDSLRKSRFDLVRQEDEDWARGAIRRLRSEGLLDGDESAADKIIEFRQKIEEARQRAWERQS